MLSCANFDFNNHQLYPLAPDYATIADIHRIFCEWKHLLVTWKVGLYVLLCIALHFGLVAQLDRALACGAKGRRFESCRVHQNWHLTLCGVLILVLKYITSGEMQEWLNWPLSKSGKAATSSRVQIPFSPPSKMHLVGCIFTYALSFLWYVLTRTWLQKSKPKKVFL